MISCGGEEKVMKKAGNASLLQTVSAEQLQKLKDKKIYWGHMSVGYNIIKGINDIMKENSMIELNIIEKNHINDKMQAFFAHSQIGENRNPKLKVDDFVKIINNDFKTGLDIAFMKFCYVDITDESNVDEIFKHYRNCTDALIKKYQKTTFIHMTVPLTVNSGLKGKIKDVIKGLMGRKTTQQWQNASNIKRARYNELLKNYYGEKNVFDLAQYESTAPGGRRQSFAMDNKIFYELVPVYTDDGGHLNEMGRRYIADRLLFFLINPGN
jgi:hypothetical protein